MGFFDKIKAAANFVTGGAAKVSVEWNPVVAFPGEPVRVRVTVTSTGPAISAGGLFIDVQANEVLNLPANSQNGNQQISHTKQTFSQTFQLTPPFQLAPNQTQQFEGHFVLPPGGQPTYDGPFADHDWGMCARVEMKGNDPDSGFQKFVVGKK